MNKLKKKVNKLISKTIDLVSGNGLSQRMNVASGDKVIFDELDKQLLSVAEEGAVLLKNDDTLPLKDDVAIFGRCQIDWFFVGYGSGGDVKPPYAVNLLDAFEENDKVRVDRVIADKYKKWVTEKENVADNGWWGHWPFYYDEMPLSEQDVVRSSERASTAVVVIGRSAGEDRDNRLSEGSLYLTAEERRMLSLVTSVFEKTCLVLNVGNVIDLSFLDEYPKITAVLLAWQLGQVSGKAVADVLTGIANPSGKLPDTIRSDYRSERNRDLVVDKAKSVYSNDVFVGYRYFDKADASPNLDKKFTRYSFGFGLSYSTFEITPISYLSTAGVHTVTVRIKNVSAICGKEVVQVYVSAPQSKLIKPLKTLVCFAKSKMLEQNESQDVTMSFKDYDFASFDDKGVTGYPYSYVLEGGRYTVFIGNSLDNAEPTYFFDVEQTKLVQKLQSICCVASSSDLIISYPNSNLREKPRSNGRNLKERILDNLPKPITSDCPTDDFNDVINETRTIDDFVSALSIQDLEALTRGEGGMDSPLGAKGNAGVIGGITRSLAEKHVPVVVTTDGPSGIRLQSYASLYPCGTALASTWNVEAVYQTFTLVAEEMLRLGSDVLLSPGMNIHSNALCGRNFEYLSEDPILSGKIASAIIRGIQSNGVSSACPKHFACNNQETNRNRNDSIISERALREIYLKGFEIAVKEGKPNTIMTAYNKINGVWCHYNYDLATTVLRNEWGYDGLVMTDWWMQKSVSPEFASCKNNAYRVRAGVDVLMPGNLSRIKKKYRSDANLIKTVNKHKKATFKAKKDKSTEYLTLGELQASAKRTLELCLIKVKGKK